jgi:hypothetical protein
MASFWACFPLLVTPTGLMLVGGAARIARGCVAGFIPLWRVIDGENDAWLGYKGLERAWLWFYQRAVGLVERNWGRLHPMMAEVLDSYADLLVRTNRAGEGIAMKSRSEAIWRAYIPRLCRTYKDVHPCLVEQEGYD